MEKNFSRFNQEIENLRALINKIAAKISDKKTDEISKLFDKLSDDFLELKCDMLYADSKLNYTNHHENNVLYKLSLLNKYLRETGEKPIYEVLGEIDQLLVKPEVEKLISSSVDNSDYEDYYKNYLPPDAVLSAQNAYRHLIKNNFGFAFYSPNVGDEFVLLNAHTERKEKRRVDELYVSGIKTEKAVLTAPKYKTSRIFGCIKNPAVFGDDE